MVARLRTVNLAQLTYDANNGGFASSLAVLNQANLIDARLASGNADEYVFKYKPVIVAGQIKQYWLWARPSAYSRTAIASCMTSETSEIHCTNEDRDATLSDPVR